MDEQAWRKLRRQVRREQRSYEKSAGASKDARMVFAALEGAYGGVLRMMDRIEESAARREP